MTMTEKLFFMGTPAQFCAVVAEYETDAIVAGRKFSYDVTAPTETVVIPRQSPPDDMGIYFRPNFSVRESVVVLRPESPRAVIRCTFRTDDVGIEFWLSALECPGNRTQIALRADEKVWVSVQEQWELIVSYMANLGWLMENETVRQAKLGEPEDWVTKLKEMGLRAGSKQWWETIEKWTRTHWANNGTTSLLIGGKGRSLSKLIGYSRQKIYENTLLKRTSFNDKDVTEDDTK